jgi:glycosyltransferase involved in cell wall biosynthesis
LQPDEPWVSRPWRQGFGDDPAGTVALERAIVRKHCKAVVIQFNFGFFNVRHFGKMLDRLNDAGRRVVVCFHATQDGNKPDLTSSLTEIIPALSRCHRLLVHSMVDLLRLDQWGLHQNVALFPHGIEPRIPRPRDEMRRRFGFEGGPIIATFGFCLPQKGLVETIEAFALLKKTHPGARLLMLNALYSEETSRETATACRTAVERHGLSKSVTINHEFLPEPACLEQLDACDVAVFAYGPTGESSSAAVRTALRSGVKILCSDMPIFDDVREAVSFTKESSARGLADSIHAFLSDPGQQKQIDNARRIHLSASSWSVCVDRLQAILEHSPV